MVMWLGDAAQKYFRRWVGPSEPVPVFCNTRCTDDASISFPICFDAEFGHHFDMALTTYHERHLAMQGWDGGDWRNKINKLFFSSGHSVDASELGHRRELFAFRNKSHFDLRHEYLPVNASSQYRYLVYAHGNPGWSRRIRELTYMRATVLYEISSCNEYFTDMYTPNGHCLPVAANFSDIGQKLEHAINNTAASERMVYAWMQRGHQILSLTCTLDYIELLLREYSRLLDF